MHFTNALSLSATIALIMTAPASAGVRTIRAADSSFSNSFNTLTSQNGRTVFRASSVGLDYFVDAEGDNRPEWRGQVYDDPKRPDVYGNSWHDFQSIDVLSNRTCEGDVHFGDFRRGKTIATFEFTGGYRCPFVGLIQEIDLWVD